jgi:hypothetical protein
LRSICLGHRAARDRLVGGVADLGEVRAVGEGVLEVRGLHDHATMSSPESV